MQRGDPSRASAPPNPTTSTVSSSPAALQLISLEPSAPPATDTPLSPTQSPASGVRPLPSVPPRPLYINLGRTLTEPTRTAHSPFPVHRSQTLPSPSRFRPARFPPRPTLEPRACSAPDYTLAILREGPQDFFELGTDPSVRLSAVAEGRPPPMTGVVTRHSGSSSPSNAQTFQPEAQRPPPGHLSRMNHYPAPPYDSGTRSRPVRAVSGPRPMHVSSSSPISDTTRGPNVLSAHTDSPRNPRWDAVYSGSPSSHAGPSKEHEAAMLARALRESQEAALMEQARVAAARQEEERLLGIALARSTEQDRVQALRLQQQRAAETRAMEESLRLERERKGKRRMRDTAQQQREREEMELAIAISLSHPSPISDVTRRFHELLTQPNNPPTSSPTSSTHVANPDDDELDVIGDYPDQPRDPGLPQRQPPAYSRPEATTVAENPRNIVIGPGLPLPKPAVSPLLLPATTRDPGPVTQRLPRTAGRRSLPSPPASGASSSYPSPAAAATTSPPPMPTRPPPMVPPQTSSFSTSSLSSKITEGVESPEVDGDPFDEAVAAIHVSWDSSDENESPSRRRHAERSDLPSPIMHAHHDLFASRHGSEVVVPRSLRSEDNALADLPALRQSGSSPGLAAPVSPASGSGPRVSPLFGGLDSFTSANAVADDALVHGVRFGFVPASDPKSQASLENEGSFPDVAQLSLLGGPEGDSQEYASFAVEASGWGALLMYLMWHGNSHFEASPRDLQHEKSEAGLACSISVAFFRDAQRETRVRCQLNLLPPRHRFYPPQAEFSLSQLTPEIVIHLPDAPVLPILLSTLAITLSAAHTHARQKAAAGRAAQVVHPAVRVLPQAVDLFKRINGEPIIDDAEEVEHEETLISKLTGRLKRRKKGPRLVKGGADGTGAGRPLEAGAPLPEGAMLLTPFMLGND